MGRACVINQPYFFPPLHWWERMTRGVPVILDDCPHNTNYPANRATVSDDRGDEHYLTLPLVRESRHDPILSMRVRSGWSAEHRNRLATFHRAAPHAEAARALFEVSAALDSAMPHRLLPVDLAGIHASNALLGLDMDFVLASDLGLGHLCKSARLIAICKALDCDRLVLGGGSKGYVAAEAGLWQDAGVEVEWQDWHAPIPNRSILDSIAWVGVDRVREVITGGKP